MFAQAVSTPAGCSRARILRRRAPAGPTRRHPTAVSCLTFSRGSARVDLMTVLAITNAHVLPISSPAFDGTVVVEDGTIIELGPEVVAPEGARIVDAGGNWLLPGFIDAHVHLGVAEEGEGWAGEDTNEMTDPVMAAVRAIDAVNATEGGGDDAVIGGVTAVNVNPGSGNPIGGLTVAIRTHGRVVDDMVLREPSGLKAALGENPKRVYGEQKKTPSTRLGDRKSTRLNSSHVAISYAVFCLKKKNKSEG